MPRPTQVVSITDPGITSSPREVLEYAHSRDITKLKFDPVTTTIFLLREIPDSLWESFVEQGVNEADRYRRAFQAGVTGVLNLHTKEQKISEWSPARINDLIKDEDLARFGKSERLEIGVVAYTNSFLHHRIVATYALPRILLDVWGELPGYLPAGSSQVKQAQSSDEASSQSQGPSPASSTTVAGTTEPVAVSVSRTDVIAEGRAS